MRIEWNFGISERIFAKHDNCFKTRTNHLEYETNSPVCWYLKTKNQQICFLTCWFWLFSDLLRRERDSNPRTREGQRFSRPPQSTTLPSLRRQKYKNFCLLQQGVKKNFFEGSGAYAQGGVSCYAFEGSGLRPKGSLAALEGRVNN